MTSPRPLQWKAVALQIRPKVIAERIVCRATRALGQMQFLAANKCQGHVSSRDHSRDPRTGPASRWEGPDCSQADFGDRSHPSEEGGRCPASGEKMRTHGLLFICLHLCSSRPDNVQPSNTSSSWLPACQPHVVQKGCFSRQGARAGLGRGGLCGACAWSMPSFRAPHKCLGKQHCRYFLSFGHPNPGRTPRHLFHLCCFAPFSSGSEPRTQ